MNDWNSREEGSDGVPDERRFSVKEKPMSQGKHLPSNENRMEGK